MSGVDSIILFVVFMLSCSVLYSINSHNIDVLNRKIEKLNERIEKLEEQVLPCSEMVKE